MSNQDLELVYADLEQKKQKIKTEQKLFDIDEETLKTIKKYVEEELEKDIYSSNFDCEYDNNEVAQRLHYFEDCIHDAIYFDENTKKVLSVESAFIKKDDLNDFFDNEEIKNLLGENFDINKYISSYASDEGASISCSLIDSKHSDTPIFCMTMGAIDGAIRGAKAGAIIGGMMGNVMSNMGGGGDSGKKPRKITPKMLRGITLGYRWGAICCSLKGAIRSNYCFTAGTKIKTNFGYVDIENIKIGDLVWSYNEDKKINELKQVVNTFVSNATNLNILEFENSIITTTKNHEFFTFDGYKTAENLTIKDTLITFDGNKKHIIKNSTKKQNCRVYNFEVEDNHNYFVGNDEILVHNRCINSSYAGKYYKYEPILKRYKETGDPQYKKQYDDLMRKYPKGVYFGAYRRGGVYPDFSGYSILRKYFDPITPRNLQRGTCLTGNSWQDSLDFKRYWEKLKNDGYSNFDIKNFDSIYTIHHLPDTISLELVPMDLHNATRHTGGSSLIKKILNKKHLTVYGVKKQTTSTTKTTVTKPKTSTTTKPKASTTSKTTTTKPKASTTSKSTTSKPRTSTTKTTPTKTTKSSNKKR